MKTTMGREDILNLEKEDQRRLKNLISKQEFFARYGDREVSMVFETIQNDQIKNSDDYDAIIIMHRKCH